MPPEIAEQHPGERMPARFLTMLGGMFVLLQLIGWVFPTGTSWGFHLLAFAPRWLSIVLLSLMAAALVPSVQKFLLSAVDSAAEQWSGATEFARSWMLVFGGVCAAVLFWLLRERVFMLGDGYLILRQLEGIDSMARLATSAFANEPLVGVLLRVTCVLLGLVLQTATPLAAVRIVSIGCGVACLALFRLFVKSLNVPKSRAMLLFIFLCGAAGSALFFGYVEDYAPLYAGMAGMIFLCMQYLKGGVPIEFVLSAFGVLFLLNFGTLIFAPVAVYVIVHAIRRNEIRGAIAGLAAASAIALAGLYVCGYTLEIFLKIFAAGVSMLNPAGGAADALGYGFLSAFHWVDVMNLLMLFSAFAVPVALFAAVADKRRDDTRMLLRLFACAGAAFIILTHSVIGLSRDWDLFASFGLPIAMLAAYELSLNMGERVEQRRTLVMICVLGIAQLTAFVAANAYESGFLDRFAALQDRRLWGTHAMLYGAEESAVFYRDHGELVKSLAAYEGYVRLDSTNKRILTNLGGIYGQLHMDRERMKVWQRAFDVGAADAYLCLTIGDSAESAGDTARAIAAYRRGLTSDSDAVEMLNNLGVLLESRSGGAREALGLFRHAIREDSLQAAPYVNAAICCFEIGDTTLGMAYVHTYARMTSDETVVGELRERYVTTSR